MFNKFWKKRKPKKTTLAGPGKKLCQFVYTIEEEGQKYDFYEFKDAGDIPPSRFNALSEFIEDKNRGVSKEELKILAEEIEKGLESNTIEGLTTVKLIADYLKASTYVSNFSLVDRILSCALFTLDEDLTDYDYTVGDWKIELFNKHGLRSFFFLSPIKRYWTHYDISMKDFELLTEQNRMISQLWTLLKNKGLFGTNTVTENT